MFFVVVLSHSNSGHVRNPSRFSRGPAYHILWLRGFRDHTISRRGFNLFKPLRRHFRATPFLPSGPRAAIPTSETPRVQKIGDGLGDLRRTQPGQVEQLGSYPQIAFPNSRPPNRAQEAPPTRASSA